MAIYSKKMRKKWRVAFERYESLCGFEPMYQEEIDDGTMTEREAFHLNVRWLIDMTGDVQNIKIPFEHEE